jgi:hypothetical protein
LATLTAVKNRQSVPGSSATSQGALDAEPRAWVRSLRAEGDERVLALERLHDLLLRAARREGRERGHLVPLGGVELDSRLPTTPWWR